MGIIDFLAASGALAWCIVIWHAFQAVRHGLQRIGWALWGYRKPRRRRTV